ncbi:hypothetical protein ACSFA8_26675 [Variovorax sp. RT4R15]|uniref:hypothetical protein n=1 Tax=Variovorax sp. RT4R15 TaxID=3443737 RepID=UPI003F48074F
MGPLTPARLRQNAANSGSSARPASFPEKIPFSHSRPGYLQPKYDLHILSAYLERLLERVMPPHITSTSRSPWSIDDYPPLRPFGWLGIMSPLILAAAALPLLALHLAPNSILDDVPLLRRFVLWMAKIIPRLTVHADATRIPQVAALVDSLMVAASMMIAAVFCVQSQFNYRYLLRRRIATGPHPLSAYAVLLLVGPPLLLSVFAAHLMLPGDPSWAAGATQSRTIFYGFLAVVITYSTGVTVGVFPLAARLFLDEWLFSRPVTICEPAFDAAKSKRSP